MNKVLITGGSGFVGGQLVAALAARDDCKVLYTYRSGPLTGIRAKGLKIDLTKKDTYAAARDDLKDVTHLIHVAAAVSHKPDDILQDLYEQVEAPIKGFRNLMLELPSIQKSIYVSSLSATQYQNELTFYGLGKFMLEETVARVASAKKIPYVNLRFPQIYGPGEPHGIFLTQFLHALKAGRPIRLENDGAVTKDILYIDDAVGSILQALHAEVSGTFTITESAPHTVREALDALAERLSVTPIIEDIEVPQKVIEEKSYHAESTAQVLGYKVRYNLAEGIEALVQATQKERDV